MKIILGIDPGLKNIGYGLIKSHNSKCCYISHDAFTTNSDLEIGDRLLEIYNKIIEIIHINKPDEAGVESLFFARNIKTAIPVAQARGVIMLALAKEGVKIFEYTPLTIKQSVAGNGRAEKSQIQEVVRIILGLKNIPKPNHAADALAVAICHVHAQTLSIKQ
jgi:crossover junction endodeoxyribonuclease RuvC